MNFIVRLYDRALTWLAAIAAGLVIVITIGVAADVLLRAIFGAPIGWMLEFTEHSLVVILFFGMGWLARERGHVAIDIVLNAVPSRFALTMRNIAAALAALTCCYMTYWCIAAAIADYQQEIETMGIYPIPRFLLFTVGAVGFLLTAVEFSRQFAKLIVGKEELRHLPPAEAPSPLDTPK